MESPNTCSIHQLAKKVRRRRFQEHTLHARSSDLHHHSQGLALLTRLSVRMRSAHRLLSDYIRVDAKREFADQYAALMTEADALIDRVESRDRTDDASWLLKLDSVTQSALLHFLLKIRNQPLWVAQCIAASTPAAVNLLTSSLETLSTASLREPCKAQDATQPPARRDALSLLLFGVFAQPGAFASEDAARFNLGASSLASLLQQSSAAHGRLCLAIMNQFADAYGWEAHNSFELLLMSLLQSGTKLLHRQEARHAAHQRANQQRFFHLYSKRDEAEEEFFAIAVRDVFRLLDGDDDAGIPAGALHLARLVMRQLPDSQRAMAETFVVQEWYFGHFLGRILKTPESAHLLHDYYISSMQRQSILEVLHQRILGFCSPVTPRVAQHTVRPTGAAEMDTHYLSITARFFAQPSDDTARVVGDAPVLRPAETFSDAATPTFYLSATDLQTLASCLLPASQQRVPSPPAPMTSTNRAQNNSVHSTTSSKPSVPARGRAWALLELVTGSDVSSTPGNVEDEGLSMRVGEEKRVSEPQDPFITNTQRAMTALALLFPEQQSMLDHRLDIIQATNKDGLCVATSTMTEPLQRRYDIDGLVKNAIYKLIDHADLGKPAQRRSTLDYFAQHRSTGPFSGVETRSPSSTGGSQLLQLLVTAAQRALSKRDYVLSELYHQAYNHLQAKTGTPEAADDYSPLLYSLLEEEESLLEQQMDLLEQKEALAAYAHDCKRRLQQRIDDEIQLINKLRLKMWYMSDVRRSKVWQQAWEVCKCLHRMRPAEVRPLGSVAEAGSFSMSGQLHSQSRERRSNRYSRELRQQHAGQFTGLYPVDHELLDALAVPVDQGGHNKLSGSQAELVLQWMRNLDIHNFCTAEERLHRLCYEVDDLIRRILISRSSVQDSVQTLEFEDAAHSLLWSFELFSYESGLFHIPKNTRPPFSFFEQLQQSVEESTIGLPRRGSAGDLLSLSRTAARQRGNSVGSIDNPRSRSRTRVSIASENDLSLPSPERQIPTASSFAAASQPLHRQISMTSTTGSAAVECDELGAREFLLQTRIGLTSLLLSDMAELLFYEGSETDEWHNTELVDAVLTAKKRQEDSAKERVTTEAILRATQLTTAQMTERGPMPAKVNMQTVPKRPPHGRMKSASLSHLLTGGGTSASLKSSPAPPSIDLDNLRSTGPILDRTSSSGSALDPSSPFTSSPRSPLRIHASLSRRAQPRQFPNARAYRELFQRFSAHPSPYEKLRTLYEFEVLVVSALSASGKDEAGKLPKMAAQMPQSPLLPQGHAISPSLAMFKDVLGADTNPGSVENGVRPVLPMQNTQPLFNTSPHGSIGQATSNGASKPGTDMIVEEMTRILKQAELRPKTLFRDLQYIATFIPSSILNMTDEGKVFWDFGLAALSVKHDTVEALTKCAESTLQCAEARRVEALQVNAATQAAEASDFTTADATAMLTIAAKERNVVAMRELALSLVPTDRGRVNVPIMLPPLSNPVEIFAGTTDSLGAGRRPLSRANSLSSSVSSAYTPSLPQFAPAGGLGIHFADASHTVSASKGSLMRMKAAVAWLELAAAEGDVVAINHLRQRQV
ncbi:hypothetical protein BCR37DRAFT_414757 [Protomyces lactucae-debilis]|uniref:Uncharacterized protein n=1 Tax=Protomyces lactucae-debilis TaxID=2754530 RepID=A0A1Y2F5R7_PROLT|nr:uncharacterized protein BCR37DRAFT_414757 [Protomyces lactucae-debilis]ORY78997.1 hypothetical protein BCR37DRAFT_414757 [Protomyces lactucae-debilis]